MELDLDRRTVELRHFIHTPESWARAVAAVAVDAAADDDDFGRAPVELSATLAVEQHEIASAAADTDEVWFSLCLHVGGHALCWGVYGGHHDFSRNAEDGPAAEFEPEGIAAVSAGDGDRARDVAGVPLHTPDSWARAVAAAALDLAAADPTFPASAVAIPAEIVVERPVAASATDQVPFLAVVCLVTRHHHICWGIAAGPSSH